MDKTVLQTIKENLYSRGYLLKKIDGNLHFIKSTDYDFQTINIWITEFKKDSFQSSLSFDLYLEKGLAFYLEPWLLQGKEKNIRISTNEGALTFNILTNKRLIKRFDTSEGGTFDWNYLYVNDFLQYFEDTVEKFIERVLQDYPINMLNKTDSLIVKAIVFEQLGDLEKAAKFLEEELMRLQNLKGGVEEYVTRRYRAYIDHLKNDTPLLHIPSPYDIASVFKLRNNNIYILLNKKTAKDTDILEYFGGVERFANGEKVSCEQEVPDDGMAIDKLGKWSVLRVGMEVLSSYRQEEVANALSSLSEAYSRAILFVNQDTSGTFGFEVYKKGGCVRRWMSGEGEVLVNEGKALSGEKKRFTDKLSEDTDEESVKSFLDAIVKITHADVEKCKGMLYTLVQ